MKNLIILFQLMQHLKNLNEKFQELQKELDAINKATKEFESSREACRKEVESREKELAQIRSDNEELSKEILQAKTQKKRRGRLSCPTGVFQILESTLRIFKNHERSVNYLSFMIDKPLSNLGLCFIAQV